MSIVSAFLLPWMRSSCWQLQKVRHVRVRSRKRTVIVSVLKPKCSLCTTRIALTKQLASTRAGNLGTTGNGGITAQHCVFTLRTGGWKRSDKLGESRKRLGDWAALGVPLHIVCRMHPSAASGRKTRQVMPTNSWSHEPVLRAAFPAEGYDDTPRRTVMALSLFSRAVHKDTNELNIAPNCRSYSHRAQFQAASCFPLCLFLMYSDHG